MIQVFYAFGRTQTLNALNKSQTGNLYLWTVQLTVQMHKRNFTKRKWSSGRGHVHPLKKTAKRKARLNTGLLHLDSISLCRSNKNCIFNPLKGILINFCI